MTRRNDSYDAKEDALDALMRANLDAELRRLGITAYRLAHLAGVSESTISRFLAGERGMGKMTLHHLLNAGAGISLDRLMAGKLPATRTKPVQSHGNSEIETVIRDAETQFPKRRIEAAKVADAVSNPPKRKSRERHG